MVKQCVKNANSLNAAFMCSFLSLTIYRCLIKITESEFSRRKNENMTRSCCFVSFFFFFTEPEKKILTLNHYEQVIVSYSVAVMYKLSWYVIPLCEPNTGLIDLNMLYFCITVICYLFTFGMI